MKNRPVKIFCLIGLLALANSGRLCAQTNTNAVGQRTNAAVKVALPAATNTTRLSAAKTAPADAD